MSGMPNMWTATIRSKDFNQGRLVLTVDYTNGLNTSTREVFLDSSNQDYKAIIQAEQLRLQGLDDLTKTIGIGPLDTTPTPPTADEVAKKAYITLVTKLNVAKSQIAVGTLQEGDKIVTDLESQVKAAFLPEYVGL